MCKDVHSLMAMVLKVYHTYITSNFNVEPSSPIAALVTRVRVRLVRDGARAGEGRKRRGHHKEERTYWGRELHNDRLESGHIGHEAEGVDGIVDAGAIRAP